MDSRTRCEKLLIRIADLTHRARGALDLEDYVAARDYVDRLDFLLLEHRLRYQENTQDTKTQVHKTENPRY